jgi:hypothetical protein
MPNNACSKTSNNSLIFYHWNQNYSLKNKKNFNLEYMYYLHLINVYRYHLIYNQPFQVYLLKEKSINLVNTPNNSLDLDLEEYTRIRTYVVQMLFIKWKHKA